VSIILNNTNPTSSLWILPRCSLMLRCSLKLECFDFVCIHFLNNYIEEANSALTILETRQGVFVNYCSTDFGAYLTRHWDNLFSVTVQWELWSQPQTKHVLAPKLLLSLCYKKKVHGFSCACVELWIYLGSFKSTKEARVALSCASRNSYASLLLSKLPASIHNSIYAR